MRKMKWYQVMPTGLVPVWIQEVTCGVRTGESVRRTVWIYDACSGNCMWLKMAGEQCNYLQNCVSDHLLVSLYTSGMNITWSNYKSTSDQMCWYCDCYMSTSAHNYCSFISGRVQSHGFDFLDDLHCKSFLHDVSAKSVNEQYSFTFIVAISIPYNQMEWRYEFR